MVLSFIIAGVILREMDLKRVIDRLIVKAALESLILNIISSYAPQVLGEAAMKEIFWLELGFI